jgi:type IV pilus assembly protein PilV
MKVLPYTNNGFSLIEVLITLIVISVGVMGLTGLKVLAIKGTNTSHYRHEASLLMMDLADRMRANLDGVNAGNYQAITAVDNTEPSKRCDDSVCSAEELATFDKYSIAERLSKTMPDSALTISCSGACNTVGTSKQIHDLRIIWKERKEKSEDMTNGEFNERSISLAIIP